MANWKTLCAYINSKYPAEELTPDRIELRLQTTSSRTQLVAVVRKEFNDEEWVELTTTVAPEAGLAPRAALDLNAALIVGALALVDGAYVLKFPLRLADLDPAEFDVPLQSLVQEGDRLEERLTAGDVY